jgi:hypothetical protein
LIKIHHQSTKTKKGNNMSLKIETNNKNVVYENQDQYYGGGYTVNYSGDPISIVIAYTNGERQSLQYVTYINAWFGSFEHSDHCTIHTSNGEKLKIKDKK